MKKIPEIKNIKDAPIELINKINELEKLLFAKASPEILKKISELINREVIDSKDTDDYNKSLVSNIIDRSILPLMNAGLDSYNPGDLLKLDYNFLSEELKKDFIKGLNGRYESFPFSQRIEADIRGRFLLKTNQQDCFENLILELENKILANKLMSDSDWVIVKKAIFKAENRLKKNIIKFPEPLDSTNAINVNFDEKFLQNIKNNFKYEERKDCHDLLALKDLISMVNLEDVEPIALGPGFFTKIIPELKEEGYQALLIKVVNNKLAEIKISTYNKDMEALYSPAEAAAHLAYNNTIFEDYQADIGMNPLTKQIRYTTRTRKITNENIFDNTQWYVILEGEIAIPEKKVPYNYEEFSHNTKRAVVGEVFLFEKSNDEILQTRVYFYPYNPSEFNILHQHGSMIWGSNDQMFHSCLKDRYKNSFFADTSIDRYKEQWARKQLDETFSPSVVAEKLHSLYIGKGLTDISSTDLLKKENYEFLKNIMQSVSEVNEYTMFQALNSLSMSKDVFRQDCMAFVRKLVVNYAPLSHRWLLQKYIEDGKGLTKDQQPRYYIQLAKKMRENENYAWFKEFSKIQELKARALNGENVDQELSEYSKKAA